MPAQLYSPPEVKMALEAIAATLDMYDDMMLKVAESLDIGTPDEFEAAGILPGQREMQKTVRNWAKDIDSDDPDTEVAFIYLAERIVGELPSVD